MARAGAAYPQAEPRAASLAAPAAGARSGDTVAAALATAEARGVRWLVVPGGGAVARELLARAAEWGLGRLPVRRLAGARAPALDAAAPESLVRRRLGEGAAAIAVTERGRALGVVERAALRVEAPAWSVGHLLERAPGDARRARLWLLREAGRAGAAVGAEVYAVGGLVRDELLGRGPLDVDLAVVGDGVALARALANTVRGRLEAHAAFGTAAIEGGRTPDGAALGRIDVATARREHYAGPGALPSVEPASIDEDLGRRDFTVNAMAVALGPDAFGRLVDPHGGRRDLAARRLRPLHVLSFAEDPTRAFRGARYAARLGLRLGEEGRRALWLALAIADSPALSGTRLRAEVALAVAEPEGWRALAVAARWGALRLWDRRWRPAPHVGRRLALARRAAALLADAGDDVDHVGIALLALLLDQPAPLRGRAAGRLGVTGRAAEELLRGAALARPLARALDAAPGPAAVAARLERVPALAAVGAWLEGSAAARGRVRWYWRRGRRARPALTGTDLLRLGVPPGPPVGAVLARLRRRVLEGGGGGRKGEERWVTRWVRARKGASR
jgi:tRNA nucleotidyltransferase (CCA-adding enzyme)